MKTWLRIGSAVTAVAAVVALMVGWTERFVGRRLLAGELATLARNGEVLSVDALRPPFVPDASNAWVALQPLTNDVQSLTGAVKNLRLWQWTSPGRLQPLRAPSGTTSTSPAPAPDSTDSTGVATNARREDENDTDTGDGGTAKATDWAAIRRELAERATLVSALGEAARRADYDRRFAYSNGFFELPPDTAPFTRVLAVLAAKTALGLRDANTNEAVTGLEDLLRLVVHQRRQPLLIDQLSRSGSVQKALALTSQALAADEWSEPDFDRIQQRWEQVEPMADFLASLTLERAIGIVHMNLVATNVVRRREALEWPAETAEIFDLEAPPRWQRWARRGIQEPLWPWLWPEHDAAWSLRHWNRRIAVARAWLRSSWDDVSFDISALDLASGYLEGIDLEGVRPPSVLDYVRCRFSLGGPSIFPDHMFFHAAAKAEVSRRLAVTALALERFRRIRGRLPDSLEELTPRFLAAVPVDPMVGKPLRYQAKADGIVLYSVGSDGKNDAGSCRTDDDETYRTPFDGRDWVFPVVGR